MSYIRSNIKKLLGLGVAFALFALILSPTTDAFSELADETLDPNAKLAVTEAGFDDMGKILDELNFTYNTISLDDLADYSKTKQYDAIFINCSFSVTANEEQAEGVREYVEGGGFVYASDWADELIDEAYPDNIQFYGESNGQGSHYGNEGEVVADIVDSGLATVLGKNKIDINFDIGSWAIIASVKKGVRVHMAGEITFSDFDTARYKETGDPKVTKEIPYVVSFSEGKGEVLYTSFHNEAQVTDDMKKALNWFAVKAKSGKLAQTSRNLTSGDDTTLQEVIDSIDQGKTKEYEFKATGEADFDVTLNFGGSELKVTVEDPDGSEVETKSVSNPPYTINVKDAEKGTYTIKVEGVDIPETNYPFVVSVTGPEKAAEEQTSKSYVTETTGNNTDSNDLSAAIEDPESFMKKLIGGAMMTSIIGGLIFLGIIVGIVVLVLKSKGKSISPAASQSQTQTPNEPTPATPDQEQSQENKKPKPKETANKSPKKK